jgi:hypothetical protein
MPTRHFITPEIVRRVQYSLARFPVQAASPAGRRNFACAANDAVKKFVQHIATAASMCRPTGNVPSPVLDLSAQHAAVELDQVAAAKAIELLGNAADCLQKNLVQANPAQGTQIERDAGVACQELIEGVGKATDLLETGPRVAHAELQVLRAHSERAWRRAEMSQPASEESLVRNLYWMHERGEAEDMELLGQLRESPALQSPSTLDLLAKVEQAINERQSQYRRNREQLSAEVLAPYAGQHVAFSADGSKILDGDADLAELERKLAERGIDPSTVVFDFIPAEDTLIGGAEFQ